MSRRTSRAPAKPPLFAACRRRAAELRRAGRVAGRRARAATEDTLLSWPIICPARRRRPAGARHRRGTPQVPAASRGGADPFDHPDAQRRFRVMDNVEELAARSGLSLGEVDHLPPSGAAAAGRARLQRPGAGLGLGRYGQDHRRPAPGRLPGPRQSRCAGAAHHLLRRPGQCARRRSCGG